MLGIDVSSDAIRQVDFARHPGWQRVRQLVLTNITYKSDHSAPILDPCWPKTFANRVLSGPQMPGSSRTDQNNWLCVGGRVSGSKASALQYRDSHQMKVVGRGHVLPEHRIGFARRNDVAFRYDRKTTAASAERKHVDQSGVRNAGEGFCAFQQIVIKRNAAAEVPAKRFARCHPGRDNRLRLKPWVHVRQLPQALDHQSGGNDQHEGKSDFRNGKDTAESMAGY